MRISPSLVGQWSQCERMACESPRDEYRIGAAAAVGSWAHALLTGGDYQLPDRVGFDTVSPSLQHLGIQSRDLADEAGRLLDTAGWTILEAETPMSDGTVSGTADLVVYHEQFGAAICEFKTGRRADTAWLQLGAYLQLAARDDLGWGGVLHVPRVRIDRPVEGRLEWRAAAGLVGEWQSMRGRMLEVAAGRPPLATPGGHCGWCRVGDCAVRAGWEGDG